jgi:hypothetical protein
MKQIKTRIAGFNHYDGAPKALTGMRPGTRLVLKPEPENPVDPKAIAIYTSAGTKLGHIPAIDCALVHEKLGDEDVHLQCVKTSDTFNSIALRYEIRDPLA